MIDSTDSTDPTVQHDPARGGFFITVDGHDAKLLYTRHADMLTMTHTGVPGAIGGRGVGGILAHAALSHARAEGLTVRPQCSYIAHYIKKHPEWADLVA